MDDRATVYVTSWGPILVKGIPRDYLLVLVMICAIFGFIFSTFFKAAMFVAMGMFGVGWIYGLWRARKDPEFTTIWIKKIQLGTTKDKGGSGNVYLP